MSGPSFNIRTIDFEEMHAFGPDHLLSRFRQADESIAGFPILRGGAGQTASDSPHLDRAALIRIVNEQNGPGRVGDDASFVVAGQQAGLLTGPLYTFLKAVSAILLARSLERASGRSHVPLFWIASEDHDLLEVNRCRIGGRRFVAGGAGEAVPSRRPQVADVNIEPHRQELLAFLDENLPPEPHRRFVLEAVSRSSFDSYADFFRDMMRELFGDALLLVDPISLRPLTAPVLADLVERWPETSSAFEEGTAFLLERGFNPPLERPGFFEIKDGFRVRVKLDDESAELSTGRCSLAEAAARIRENPNHFSPNAALRPVLQDAVIPASAFVAGPSELLYLWQIDAIYKAVRVKRAPLYPRISATFLDPAASRAVRKAGLRPEEIFRLPSISRGSILVEKNQYRELTSVEKAGRAFINSMERCLEIHDTKWLRRTRSSLTAQLDKLYGKMNELMAEKEGVGRRRLEKIEAAAFPGGLLQERTVCPFEFVARYGPAFVDMSLRKLNPWLVAHQIVEIDTSGFHEKSSEDKDS